MIQQRKPKLVQCQDLSELSTQVEQHKLLDGDVVEHKNGFKVLSAKNMWLDSDELEIVQEVCRLFEDPISAYNLIALRHPLRLKIDINHPAVPSYIGKFDKRWWFVEVSMKVDYSGWYTDKEIRVCYGKDFYSPGLSGFSFLKSWHDTNTKPYWNILEKLLEPKVEVLFVVKKPMSDAVCRTLLVTLFKSRYFPDESLWVTGNGRNLYKMVDSVDYVEKKWDVVKSYIGDNLLRVVFSRTCYELECPPQEYPKFKVSRLTILASQYVHQIILDVCICFFPICPPPYVLLWIFNQCPITKHDYIRKRIHVIEKIYESMRKVCKNRTNKRVKIL